MDRAALSASAGEINGNLDISVVKKASGRAFDVLGIVAVAAFLLVLAVDFYELRWSALEVELEPAQQQIADGFREGALWYGLYIKDTKVGYLRVDRRRRGDGYAMRSRTLLEMTFMGRLQRMTVDLDTRLDSAMALESFTVDVSSDLLNLSADGRWADGRLEIELATAGLEETRSLSLERPPALDLNLRALLMQHRPEEGDIFRIDGFDPISLSTRVVELEYLGLDRVAVVDAQVPAHRFRQLVAGRTLEVWVNDLGEVLREQLPMGVVAVRETEAMATFELASRHWSEGGEMPEGVDVMELFSDLAAAGGDR
jgi:hypothetical protein